MKQNSHNSYEEDILSPYFMQNLFSAPNTGKGISGARLRLIRQRISDGYYDRPEVIAETARRIMSNREAPSLF